MWATPIFFLLTYFFPALHDGHCWFETLAVAGLGFWLLMHFSLMCFLSRWLREDNLSHSQLCLPRLERNWKDKKAIISQPPCSFSGTLPPSLPLFSEADDKWRKRRWAAGASGVCVCDGVFWGSCFISAHVKVEEQHWPQAPTVFSQLFDAPHRSEDPPWWWRFEVTWQPPCKLSDPSKDFKPHL